MPPQDTAAANLDGLERDVHDVLDAPRDPQAVLKILERALNYRDWVREMHDSLDVSDEVIAEITGVVVGSVRRWRSNDPDVGEPRHAQGQAIERLRRIAVVLVASETFYDLRGVGVWLRTGQRNLGWKSPAEILAEDLSRGYERVLHEAEQFVRPGAGAAGFGGTRRNVNPGD